MAAPKGTVCLLCLSRPVCPSRPARRDIHCHARPADDRPGTVVTAG